MNELHRLPDWRLRLDALIYSRLHAPFAWGVNDCAIFAADAIEACTGIDVAPDLRGHLTARQAVRVLHRYDGVAGIAASRLSSLISVPSARPGDVVAVPIGRRLALGVMHDGDMVLGPSHAGLAAVPRAQALLAWRVGA